MLYFQGAHSCLCNTVKQWITYNSYAVSLINATKGRESYMNKLTAHGSCKLKMALQVQCKKADQYNCIHKHIQCPFGTVG